MGQTVYDCGPVSEGAHIFAHSRKDGKEGVAYLVVNNSLTETTTLELPKEADVYMLSGNGKLRSRTMLLNGRELVLGENDEMPSLAPEKVSAGTLEVDPGNCAFVVL